MRTLVCLAAAAAAVLAGPSPVRAYKSTLHDAKRAEAKYLRDLQGRVTEALIAFRAEIEKADAQPEEHPEATWNYEPFETMYADYERISRARAEAAATLAASGDPKAAETLGKSLLDTAKRIDKLDAELRKAKPKLRRVVFEPELGIQRHGFAMEVDGLVEALARCPGAAAYLAGPLWAAAEKADGKRSIVRRAAVLDALARAGGDAARDHLAGRLADGASSVRLIAAEGLVRLGAAGCDAARLALDDTSPVVRRAVLQEIPRHAAKTPAWIPHLVAHLSRTAGVEAELCVRALAALTGQTFGHDAKAWAGWLADYKGEIESGAFDLAKVEVREAKPAPPAATVSFYGVTAPAHRLVFVLDTSRFLMVPADWDVQRTKFRSQWYGTIRQWEDRHRSHLAVLQGELEAAIGGAPADARYNAVFLYGTFLADPWAKGWKKPTAKTGAALAKQLPRMVGRGWCGQLEGLRRAAELGGLDPWDDVHFKEPELDTVFLVDVGDPAGGRYLTPASALAAFRRFHRFRRITVHTIRICHEKEAAETLMKGIAEISGGTYVWAKKQE